MRENGTWPYRVTASAPILFACDVGLWRLEPDRYYALPDVPALRSLREEGLLAALVVSPLAPVRSRGRRRLQALALRDITYRAPSGDEALAVARSAVALNAADARLLAANGAVVLAATRRLPT
jgi:hypothetical protein